MVRARWSSPRSPADDPLRRPARAGRTRQARRRSEALRRFAIAGMKTEWKIDQALRAEEAALDVDPRIHELRRRVVRFVPRLAGVCEFARLRRQLPHLELRPERRPGGQAERVHGARLLAHVGARGSRVWKVRKQVGTRAAERAMRRLNPRKVPTQKVPVIFEPRTARHASGRSFRRRQRRRHLSPRVVPGGQAGRKDRLRSADRDRRCHHARPVRQLAFRRRRRGLAAHRGDRARRSQELSAEHLLGAQAGSEDHRQRVARDHRQRGRRSRQFLIEAGHALRQTI